MIDVADRQRRLGAAQRSSARYRVSIEPGSRCLRPRHCASASRHAAAARARRVLNPAMGEPSHAIGVRDRIAAKADARLAQLPRVTHPVGRDVDLADAELVALIERRRAAQRQQQHRRDARLRLAELGGDARMVMAAEHPIGPAAGGQRRFIVGDHRPSAAASQGASISWKLKGRCTPGALGAVIGHQPIERQDRSPRPAAGRHSCRRARGISAAISCTSGWSVEWSWSTLELLAHFRAVIRDWPDCRAGPPP